jgi:aminocarboxymuconate-semialdehyde decarboxylase
MSLAGARVIDLHAHAVLAETFGAAGTYGPELGAEPDGTPVFRIGDYRLRGVRYRGSAFMDVDIRLAAMDRSGIDWQLLSPNPLTYFHWIPAADAVAFCRRHNDALAALVAPHADRLGAAAALPMQDVAAAIAEARRAVRTLGMKAVYIGTDFPNGLDSPALDPFYEALVALDVPLFLHPGPEGIDGPPGNPALKRHELDILAGFTAQETAAVATLLFGGVLHRHPGLDVCVSHGGGAVAFLWGRLRQAARLRPWVPDWLKADGAFDAALQRLWYDMHLHDEAALALLASRVGTERLVYGTNFAGWDAPASYRAPGVDAPLADNARRLLRA